MAKEKLLPYYTYKDYCNWEGRWEIIEGISFAMSPSPNMKHQWLVANIIYELKKATKESECKHCKVYDFIDLKVEEDTVLQPDCSVICGATKKNYLDFPPALVAEILSESIALKDKITKFAIYEKFGIKYYLIVDPDKDSLEIYLLINEKYVLQKFSEKPTFNFSLSDNCEIGLAIKNIWE